MYLYVIQHMATELLKRCNAAIMIHTKTTALWYNTIYVYDVGLAAGLVHEFKNSHRQQI